MAPGDRALADRPAETAWAIRLRWPLQIHRLHQTNRNARCVDCGRLHGNGRRVGVCGPAFPVCGRHRGARTGKSLALAASEQAEEEIGSGEKVPGIWVDISHRTQNVLRCEGCVPEYRLRRAGSAGGLLWLPAGGHFHARFLLLLYYTRDLFFLIRREKKGDGLSNIPARDNRE